MTPIGGTTLAKNSVAVEVRLPRWATFKTVLFNGGALRTNQYLVGDPMSAVNKKLT